MSEIRVEINGNKRTFIGLYERTSVLESLQQHFNKKNSNGMFIAFEGSDCCGKGIQLKIIAEYIEKQYNKKVVTCFDPGSTDIGAEIRYMLKHTKTDVTPATELLLFAAARQAMIEEIIRPALGQNKIVLCDRYIQSSIIYQIFTKNLRQPLMNERDMIFWNTEPVKILIEKMKAVHAAFSVRWPELIFVFDINEETYNKRRSLSRQEEQDRFENDSEESKTFMREVRRGYQLLCQNPCPFGNLPGQYVMINGNRTTEEVSEQIKKVLHEYCNF